MFLSERMKLVFDGTAIELHLIHYCLWVSDNTIRVPAIEAVKFLCKRKLCQRISIEDDIFFSINKWYFHDAEIDILKLPEKYIHDNKWDDGRITRDAGKKSNNRIYLYYLSIFSWDDKVFHKYEYRKIAKKSYLK